jgi:high-affinity nickel permease
MSMPTTAFGLLGFGFVLGLRHALDVDHLAAVSTIVNARRGLVRSALVGAVWGLGHTASLLAVAVAVVGLRTEIPPVVATALEMGVAAMLIVLGVNLLRTLVTGGRLHAHAHVHGGRLHVHPHLHEAAADAVHDHAPIGRRPFLVGLVHGLAGSAGLLLGVVATIPSPALALTYVVVFGVGSIGGMALMSTLLGVPLALAAERWARAERWLGGVAAAASIAIGIALAWELGRTALGA